MSQETLRPSVQGEIKMNAPQDTAGLPGSKRTPMSECQSTFWTEGGHCLEVWDTFWGAEEEHLGITQNFLWDV